MEVKAQKTASLIREMGLGLNTCLKNIRNEGGLRSFFMEEKFKIT